MTPAHRLPDLADHFNDYASPGLAVVRAQDAAPFGPADWRRAAKAVQADIDAGRLQLFHGRLCTREEIDRAVKIGGGYLLPGSVGAPEFGE